MRFCTNVIDKVVRGVVIALLWTILIGKFTLAQIPREVDMIDSLTQVLDGDPKDSTELNTLIFLSRKLQYLDAEKGLDYGNSALAIAKRLEWAQQIGEAANVVGENCHELGLYEQAMVNFKTAIEVFIEVGDMKGESKCYSNMALAQLNKGDYNLSLDYNMEALRLREKIGEPKLIARTLTNLGALYYYMSDLDKSIEYFKRALKMYRKLGDPEGISIILNNIGAVMVNQGNCKESLIYQKKGLKLRVRLGDKITIASSLNNIGNVHDCLKNYQKAISYYERSLALKQELNDQYGMANTLRNIALVYNKLEEYESCISYLNESLGISKKINSKAYIKEVYKEFSNVFSNTGDYKEALKYRKLFIEEQDSLFNEDKSKEIGKLEAQYEMEKKVEKKQRELDEKNKVIEEAESRRNILQYSGILVFISLLFTGVFMMGRFSLPIKLAEGLVFFSFLLFFEFSLVLLDPYIEELSSGAPAIKLGFNALLAAAIFPLHSFFEERLKNKLIRNQ